MQILPITQGTRTWTLPEVDSETFVRFTGCTRVREGPSWRRVEQEREEKETFVPVATLSDLLRDRRQAGSARPPGRRGGISAYEA